MTKPVTLRKALQLTELWEPADRAGKKIFVDAPAWSTVPGGLYDADDVPSLFHADQTLIRAIGLHVWGSSNVCLKFTAAKVARNLGSNPSPAPFVVPTPR